jgi:hypothetical protein
VLAGDAIEPCRQAIAVEVWAWAHAVRASQRLEGLLAWSPYRGPPRRFTHGMCVARAPDGETGLTPET